MELLTFRFEGGTQQLSATNQLVGVVGSGNLEVLVCHADLPATCEIEVNTAAVGFAPIWQAVMSDFHDRWQLANVKISINDMGATPAVVRLRLDQAVQTCLDRASAGRMV